MKYYIALTSRGTVLAKDLPDYLIHHSEAWYKHYTKTFFSNPEKEWEEDMQFAIAVAHLFDDQKKGWDLMKIAMDYNYDTGKGFAHPNKFYPIDLIGYQVNFRFNKVFINEFRESFCIWYYAQAQPLDANEIFEWFNNHNF